MNKQQTATCTARPSLALMKYWGKSFHHDPAVNPQPTAEKNIPASPSLAVTLAGIETRTKVSITPAAPGSPHIQNDQVLINGQLQDPGTFQDFFTLLRDSLTQWRQNLPQGFLLQGTDLPVFHAESQNSFPTAAGLASSASGFAALTGAAVSALIQPRLRPTWQKALAEQELQLQNHSCKNLASIPVQTNGANPTSHQNRNLKHPHQAGQADPKPYWPKELMALPDSLELSRIARVGSGSASRSVFGGFTLLPAGAGQAIPLASANFWPDFRIILLRLTQAAKPISSRQAMNRTRDTSPYYPAWLEDSRIQTERALEALSKKDIQTLGNQARLSYLRMFSTMFSADPPVIYWLPQSLQVIHMAQGLTSRGHGVWETMDAGPQVKLITLVDSMPAILDELEQQLPGIEPVVCQPGPGLEFPNV